MKWAQNRQRAITEGVRQAQATPPHLNRAGYMRERCGGLVFIYTRQNTPKGGFTQPKNRLSEKNTPAPLPAIGTDQQGNGEGTQIFCLTREHRKEAV